jgi:hypothetical protein
MQQGPSDSLAGPEQVRRWDNRLIFEEWAGKSLLFEPKCVSRRRRSLGRPPGKKLPQSFLDNSFFVREVAVRDLPSQELLQVDCERNIHRVDSRRASMVEHPRSFF